MKEQMKKKRQNRGSVTVEACLIVPLFLFFMLAMADMLMLFIADAHIHQSLAEAAGYTAQYAYLEELLINKARTEHSDNEVRNEKQDSDTSLNTVSAKNSSLNTFVNTAIVIQKFREYLGDDFYVEKIISGGKNGIIISVEPDADNPKIFIVRALFCGQLKVPLIGNLTVPLTEQIRQKAFLGYSSEEEADDTYVYVTPNESVYHTKRSCTHLSLSVSSASGSRKGDYTACRFCGKKDLTDNKIYLTRTTNVYHTDSNCSGLKRTVKRIKKSEAAGLSPCSRCGK